MRKIFLRSNASIFRVSDHVTRVRICGESDPPLVSGPSETRFFAIFRRLVVAALCSKHQMCFARCSFIPGWSDLPDIGQCMRIGIKRQGGEKRQTAYRRNGNSQSRGHLITP